MTDTGSSWVAAIDLDGDRDQLSADSAVAPRHARARVLVRWHGAPLGYVETSIEPESTLPVRVAAAADVELAQALREHRAFDQAGAENSGGGGADRVWAAQVTCPQRFPTTGSTGITAIVCTRNRPEALRECLHALQRSVYEPAEFLIVDNAPSDDATRRLVDDLARADARIRYTRERLPGLSRARNHGVACARYDWLAFTDDDIRVEPSWLAAMAAGFASDPDAVCITGPVAARSLDTRSERYFDSRYQWAGAFEPRRFDLCTHRGEGRLYPFTAGIFGTGANFGIRRSIATELGGFDPLLGAGGPGKGGEDLDMFLRVVQAGHRICYLPAALVWHRHRATDEALAEQVYGYGHGLGAYIAKRLMKREVSARMFVRGLGHSAVLADQVRRASRSSKFRTHSWQLAGREASGVLVGAARFYLTARRERQRSPSLAVPTQ